MKNPRPILFSLGCFYIGVLTVLASPLAFFDQVSGVLLLGAVCWGRLPYFRGERVTCFSTGALVQFWRGPEVAASRTPDIGRAVDGAPPPCALLPFAWYCPWEGFPFSGVGMLLPEAVVYGSANPRERPWRGLQPVLCDLKSLILAWRCFRVGCKRCSGFGFLLSEMAAPFQVICAFIKERSPDIFFTHLYRESY